MIETEQDLSAVEMQSMVGRDAQEGLVRLGYTGSPPVRFGSDWACNIVGGQEDIVINEAAYGDETYEPEWRVLAFQHEVEAHYAVALREPASAERDRQWADAHPAGHLFLNVLADIAGNRAIMAKDPAARPGFDDFYKKKLFVPTDYRFQYDKDGQMTDRPRPRHIQMLYVALREKMVPDEICVVDQEVRDVLDQLKNYKGIDLLDYATGVFKTPKEYLSRTEQMNLWEKFLWPKYLELFELDTQDRAKDPNNDQPQDGEEATNGGSPFQSEYEKYEQDHHPGGKPEKSQDDPSGKAQEVMAKIMGGMPSSKTEAKSSGETAEHSPSEEDRTGKNRENNEPVKRAPTEREKAAAAREAFAAEQGVSVEDLRMYQRILEEIQATREQMYPIFEMFINARTGQRWRVSHQRAEGVLLDPDNLARTVIQISTGRVEDARPFMDYEQVERERELSGKNHFWFVVDTSGSMRKDGKSAMAARAVAAALEGLSDFQRIVTETSQALGYDLDLDNKSAVISFGNGAHTLKPLGKDMTVRDRCHVAKTVANPPQEGTADFLALDEIALFYESNPNFDPNHKKIVIVVTDGQSDNPSALKAALERLAKIPNLVVYAIGIQDQNAETNYAPNGSTITDVTQLPDTLSSMITRFFR